MQTYERLDGGNCTLVIAADAGDAPRLVYLGARLADNVDLTGLDAAQRTGPRESTPDDPPPPTLFPPAGFGWLGAPAISGRHDCGDGALSWSACEILKAGDTLRIDLYDRRAGLRATLAYKMDAESGILSTSASVCNDAASAFRLARVASLCLPLPSWATEILAFEGDWSREAKPVRMKAPPGTWSRVNRTGRTGFSGSSFAVMEAGADDQTGRVLALHLGWSGDHVLEVDTLSSGRRLALVGVQLAPGEVVLEQGESFEAPTAYASLSLTGFNGVSDSFHPFVRRAILPPRAGARKIHFNSWEAAYFDFDAASLRELADAAASLGVERFVLDDGWYAGRRNDSSSLGDWRVDSQRFPDGLSPFIEHVHDLGMDFGLWVEPEMVSPDSDLYRLHPDWCVHAVSAARPTMRSQLWLDMSRAEVRDHIFDQLDALLSGRRIAYLKWDCNRFQFPATSGGAPAGASLVRGTYALLDRLRAAHPDVEIESCASGGARIDLEILKRTTRIWPSDTTDAVERLRIQRWASLLLPLETIGAHVGPDPNPITGRRLPMDFRAKVAMFGHFGVETDPLRLDDQDRDCLIAHIELFKRHRALIHSGRHLRWTTDDGAEARMCVSGSRSEALILVCRADVAAHAEAAPVRIPGLDPAARYRVTLPGPWPAIAQRRLADAQGWREGYLLSGEILEQSGLALPLADPQTAWLVHLERA